MSDLGLTQLTEVFLQAQSSMRSWGRNVASPSSLLLLASLGQPQVDSPYTSSYQQWLQWGIFEHCVSYSTAPFGQGTIVSLTDTAWANPKAGISHPTLAASLTVAN